jgi:MoxR-like ATPase
MNTEQTTETKPELVEAECVFIGQRATRDGKLSECWLALDTLTRIVADKANEGIIDEMIDRMASVFDVKRTRAGHPSVVGGIYAMKVRIEGDSIQSASLASKQFRRQYADENLVIRWASIDSAAKMQHKARLQVEKLKSNHVLERELIGLRAHYQKMPFQDRTAFELMVLNFIRRNR